MYFHTRLLDARCLLVIELILVEKTEHVTVQEVGVGWAALNSVQVRTSLPLSEQGLACTCIKEGPINLVSPHLSPPVSHREVDELTGAYL